VEKVNRDAALKKKKGSEEGRRRERNCGGRRIRDRQRNKEQQANEGRNKGRLTRGQ